MWRYLQLPSAVENIDSQRKSPDQEAIETRPRLTRKGRAEYARWLITKAKHQKIPGVKK
jgi:hypothetical protein